MSDPHLTEEAQKEYRRYLGAAHAMQSAVAHKMNFDPQETSPKHLRVGLNAAMVESAALVGVLVDKGLITYEDFYRALADKMEAEVETYRSELPYNVRFG